MNDRNKGLLIGIISGAIGGALGAVSGSNNWAVVMVFSAVMAIILAWIINGMVK